MTRTLPHAPYITAIETALTDAALIPETVSTFEDELDGHPLLRGTALLTPETSGIPADRWPHGLLLVWEWHTGRDPEVERGASWAWARAIKGGWAERWGPLPVTGWAAPESVAAAAMTLAHTGTPTAMASLWHEHLRVGVKSAVIAWAAEAAPAT